MKTSENLWLKKKKRFNQIKAAIILLTALTGLVFELWWPTALFVLLAWVTHEVLWSDHIFYNPKSDYIYDLDSDYQTPVSIDHGQITVEPPPEGLAPDTWLLALNIKASWPAGHVYDPCVTLKTEGKERKQYFERGTTGLRYLNLSCFTRELNAGQIITITPCYCSLASHKGMLYGFANPDVTSNNILIVAPHADDAEIAAFGLYSQHNNVHIVTLTAGEVEMEDYSHVYSQPEQASLLKGRLRAMDSMAIPLWGGVAQENCIQLGYFCKRLEDMHNQPDQDFPSLTAGCHDTRLFRRFNKQRLSSDTHGSPSWNNLIQDLVELLDRIQPDIIITPDTELDPHSDHIYGTKAIRQAVGLSSRARPHTELAYANHYAPQTASPLARLTLIPRCPPQFSCTGPRRVFSYGLSEEIQKDKVFALEMMHDLKPKDSFKKLIRRQLRKWLIKRSYNRYGSDPYFDKAIRPQELFFVRRYSN